MNRNTVKRCQGATFAASTSEKNESCAKRQLWTAFRIYVHAPVKCTESSIKV